SFPSKNSSSERSGLGVFESPNGPSLLIRMRMRFRAGLLFTLGRFGHGVPFWTSSYEYEGLDLAHGARSRTIAGVFLLTMRKSGSVRRKSKCKRYRAKSSSGKRS